MRESGYILVLGAAGLDSKGRSHKVLQAGSSNPGIVRNSFGGVARNIAENLARLGQKTLFLSVLGDDPSGDLLLAHAAAAGIDTSVVVRLKEAQTGSYLAVLDHEGDLAVAVSDFSIMQYMDAAFLESRAALFEQAQIVVADLNLTEEALVKIIELCQRYQVRLCIDPTSTIHTKKLRHHLAGIYLITPNVAEAGVLAGVPAASDYDTVLYIARALVKTGIQIVVITMGDKGLVYASAEQQGYIAARPVHTVDSTGAGDALSAAVIFGLVNGMELDKALRLGMTAAVLTLQSRDSVLQNLTADLLYEHLIV